MTPAQQRILRRLVEDVTAAMIAEALAHRAFLRAPSAQLRASYQLWMEVARQKTEAQGKLDRALGQERDKGFGPEETDDE